jgi:hypothetical protein
MRALQIVGMGVRLFAVVLVILGARYSTGLLAAMEDASAGTVAVVVLLTVVVPVVASLLLWFFPLTVASKILPPLQAEEHVAPLGAHELHSVGISLIGLWVLATAIPDLVYWVSLAYFIGRSEYAAATLPPDQLGGVVATVAEILVGMGLLFGSKGLAGLVRRFRSAGA